MKKYAILDVGTNNVLMLWAKKENRRITTVKREAVISAMGKGMQNGLLTSEAVTNTKKILKDNILRSLEFTKNIIIVGTSSSREAENISEISSWTSKEFGLKYIIISGEREAELNGIANINEFKDIGDFILFDVGGGSTEFTFVSGGKIEIVKTLKLGIRRLHNLHDNFEQRQNFTKKILQHIPQNTTSVLVGVGGTATSLGAIKNKLKKYNAKVVHKSKITAPELAEIIDRIGKMPLDDLKELMTFDVKRADIILTGTMIVSEIINYFGASEFYVSDKGLQYGILNLGESEIAEMLSDRITGCTG
jgi:exopolyphosphatase / guanosine-5'-triphosphate,3'-diphosphate pyrophosphatase